MSIKINVYKNKTSKSCETFRNLALAWPGSRTMRRSRSRRKWWRHWEVSSNCFELAERKRKLLKRAPNTHRRSARKGCGGRLHCCLIEMCTNWNLLELFERSPLSLSHLLSSGLVKAGRGGEGKGGTVSTAARASCQLSSTCCCCCCLSRCLGANLAYWVLLQVTKQ